MLNTYGGNNQIEHWIRCMVADELKQRGRLFNLMNKRNENSF